MLFYTFISGRGSCGQLGLGDTLTKDLPEEIPALQEMNIISAAAGRNHSLFLTGKEFNTKYALYVLRFVPSLWIIQYYNAFILQLPNRFNFHSTEVYACSMSYYSIRQYYIHT